MSDLFSKINRYGVVRIPFWFWLVVLFEARYWILAGGAAASVRRSPDAARVLGSEGVPWLHLSLELPVLLLAFAAANRDPQCGSFLRLVWHRGRELITLACVLNLAWVGVHLARAPYWKAWPDNLLLLAGAIDVAIIVGAWVSAEARQLFEEFPAPGSGSGG